MSEQVTATDESDVGGPHGLLQWGQAGVYNAPDDRMVIAALSDQVTGIVKPVIILNGPGLSFTVQAGWLAIASCEDGTSCVVGSRQSHTLGPDDGVIAGPATGERRDLLWCDVFPEDGEWRLSVIREQEAAGRPGVALLRIAAPAGASAFSQFTTNTPAPTFGDHADGVLRGGPIGPNPVFITPWYPIAPQMVRPNSLFTCRAWGVGRFGASVGHFAFGDAMPDSPVAWLYMGQAAWATASAWFSWECEATSQMANDRTRVHRKITAMMSPGYGAGGTLATHANGISGVRIAHGQLFDPDAWLYMRLQARSDRDASGQALTCVGSSFRTIEPYDVGARA